MPAAATLALLLCLPAAVHAGAAAASAPSGTGLADSFFSGARQVSSSERRGSRFYFRSMLLEKGAARLRLEITSPFSAAEAGKWARRRLEVYRGLISPSRLDYHSGAEREVSVQRRYRGELLPGGDCPGFELVLFPADAALKPAAGGVPAYMGVAGFFFNPATGVMTEAVLYRPAEGFDRAGAAAAFRSALCRLP